MRRTQEKSPRKRRASRRRWVARLLAACFLAMTLAGALSGCQTVGPQQQRLVSKSNMEFSDSPVWSYQNKLTPQLEPGSLVSGGALSSGCTSCK